LPFARAGLADNRFRHRLIDESIGEQVQPAAEKMECQLQNWYILE
jgi:hypothetical protein